MIILKLFLVTVVLVGFVFGALSLKLIFKKNKTNSTCDSSDVGYSCGCGGGQSCSTNSAKKGF